MRPRQAAHLSSSQRMSQNIVSSSTLHGHVRNSRRHYAATRAESGNGATPAPSGLAINLTGEGKVVNLQA